jgi:NHL repeat
MRRGGIAQISAGQELDGRDRRRTIYYERSGTGRGDPPAEGTFPVRRALRTRGVAFGLAVAAGATACSGTPARSLQLTPSTSPSAVPNPFTIVARYTASSLGLHRPIDLAIGPDGNVYITDAEPSVTVMAPDGRLLLRWGSSGSRPGEFSFEPDLNDNLHASIAVGEDGTVYVSDSGNSRVDVFTSTGAFLRQFGSQGIGHGRFMDVFDLAADAQGDVYVADDQVATLSKFSPTGSFEWSIGGFATRDPDLRGHFHLATVDPHGRVVAAIAEARRIVYIDAAGRKVDAFTTTANSPDGPCNATVDAEGDTVVQSCPPGRSTLLFDRTHHLIGAWTDSPFLTDVPPTFDPNGEAFAIGVDNSILRLKVALPGA